MQFAIQLPELRFSRQPKPWLRIARLGWMLVSLLSASAAGFGAQADHAGDVRGLPSHIHYANSAPGVAYVGSARCAPCHQDIYASFQKTGMGRSMSPADSPTELARVPFPVTIYDRKSNLYFNVFRQGTSLFQSEYKLDSKVSLANS
jgi:hypothetical protein